MTKCIMLEEDWGVANLKTKERNLRIDLIYKGNSFHISKNLAEMDEDKACKVLYEWLLSIIDAEDIDNLYKSIKNAISLCFASKSMFSTVNQIKTLKAVFQKEVDKIQKATTFPKEAIMDFIWETDNDICINIRN